MAEKTDNIDEPQAEPAAPETAPVTSDEATRQGAAAGEAAPPAKPKPARRTRKATSEAPAEAAAAKAPAEAAAPETPADTAAPETPAAPVAGTGTARKPRARVSKPKAEAAAAKRATTPAKAEATAEAKAPAEVEAPAASEVPAERAARPRRAAKLKPAAKAEATEPVPPARRKPATKAAKTAAEPKPKAVPKTGTPGKATVVDAEGRQVETLDLRPELFAVPANVNSLHLVVRASQAARRRGTASTKNRGEVSGSTAKLYRQKGTGRARVGSDKSPTRVGGGVAFGPRPRSYDIKVNRKVVRKALAMALSDRAGNGSVFVARELDLDAPSTASMNRFLFDLNVAVPVLVVTNDEPNITLSTRNLVYAEAVEVATLTTEQVLRARSLVLTEKAFSALNQA